MKKIKVMIAEDHEMWRDLLSDAITRDCDNIEVTGLAKNGTEIVDLVRKSRPDVLILDLNMPGLHGIEVLKIISSEFPKIRTVILSVDYSDFYIAEVMLNGAAAYVLKKSGFQEVIQAINGVYKDGFFFNHTVSANIFENLRNTNKLYYLLENEKFSVREIDILKMVANNVPVNEIAKALKITARTVKFHTDNMREKIGGDTLVGLIRFAFRQLIARPDGQ